ncbi:hypothetical protein FisN_28Lu119 [Fistulifera solaris]|jgi:hypothetical protein|uniref:Uncharacterized protein n=1 Tax=Fistulifera solaris TaxID=1519565 RepID=A0A1Z5K564_FISSO|nr:hypothetical protein FisN_28Lu119 [Fistulifera solaris]|eukprot:GAX21390.1 hypothetical protein FisN_28Lu119 [Fistulifera solaris]
MGIPTFAFVEIYSSKSWSANADCLDTSPHTHHFRFSFSPPLHLKAMKFLSIVLTHLLIHKAVAGPNGASACPAGAAAPAGPHVEYTPGLLGEVTEGNYVVSVSGSPIPLDGTVVEAGLDFDIQVTGAEFKGILIRVGGATADQVTSTDLVAPAEACAGVGSVNHGENILKSVGTATVSLDAPTILDIDLSIVVENTAGASTFYYSAFQINAVDDSAPVGEETDAPVDEETDAPIGEETEAPVDEETEPSEEESETETPVSTPVEAPAAAPTSSAMAIGNVAATLAGAFTLFF